MYQEKDKRKIGASRILVGVGVGMALEYLLDPNLGRRRRSLLRDQVVHAMSKSAQVFGTTLRDFRHRLYGSWVELRTSLKTADVSDAVLIERVRSRIGRHVSHASAIEVSARNGRVTLKGLILDTESPGLNSAVRSVRGVKAVENLLEAHQRSEDIPRLQGGTRRPGEAWEQMQEQWSPTSRLLASSAGCALMVNCLNRRTPGAVLLGTFGFGLGLRAMTNIATRRLLGTGVSRHGIDLQKTVTILAPVEAVFSLLARPTNYPRITESVKSVRQIAEGYYEKKVSGPMGMEIWLDEVITRLVPEKVMAFKSGRNSALKYAGVFYFEPTNDGGTRVDMRFTYNPRGGIFSHSAAKLAGFDPKAYFDDLFGRAKSFLETGNRLHDAAERTPPDVHYHNMNIVTT